jgi:hypothetical protein
VPKGSLSLAEIEGVYRRRGADFFRLALAKTGDREAARDAVQDGFAQAIPQPDLSDDALDRLAPALPWQADWGDVLQRAGESARGPVVPRRFTKRRLIIALVVLAAVFYATGLPQSIVTPGPGSRPFSLAPTWVAGLDGNGNVVACLAPLKAKEGISPLSECR